MGARSAGAVPGPACYGRGGTEPTVTDAALVLGMLGDGELSNDLRLDRDASERAVAALADELAMSVEQAARGVLTVASAAMAEAIREITIGQGEDPREAKLVTFGGAGPLFGTLLADELDVPEIVVPPYAGNFSAWGLLGQDVTHDAARTTFRVLDAALLDELNGQLAEMFAELERRHDDESLERTVGLDLRYVGQEHTLTVLRTPAGGRLASDDLGEIERSFAAEYERRFGTTLDEMVEVVTVRATTRQTLPRKGQGDVFSGETTGVDRAASVRSFSFTRGDWLDFAVRERASIAEDAALAGPAVIFEPTATTYVDAGYAVRLDPSGCLLLTREEDA